jgi:hypothetical protein
MAEGRVLTHKILMILLFCSGTFALRAQEKNYESHWYWRAGVTASISTYKQARDGGEGPTYDVPCQKDMENIMDQFMVSLLCLSIPDIDFSSFWI